MQQQQPNQVPSAPEHLRHTAAIMRGDADQLIRNAQVHADELMRDAQARADEMRRSADEYDHGARTLEETATVTTTAVDPFSPAADPALQRALAATPIGDSVARGGGDPQ